MKKNLAIAIGLTAVSLFCAWMVPRVDRFALPLFLDSWWSFASALAGVGMIMAWAAVLLEALLDQA